MAAFRLSAIMLGALRSTLDSLKQGSAKSPMSGVGGVSIYSSIASGETSAPNAEAAAREARYAA